MILLASEIKSNPKQAITISFNLYGYRSIFLYSCVIGSPSVINENKKNSNVVAVNLNK